MGFGVAKVPIQPETLEERLVYWTMISTWGLWLLGALYIVSPVLGWTLVGISFCFQAKSGQRSTSLPTAAQFLIGVWSVAVLTMLLALFVAHANFSLSFEQTLKSTIGWMKGWALLAAFLAAGAMSNVRPQLIFRASNILALQTLLLVPVFLAAPALGLPKSLYVSPLLMLGGPGPEFFNVELYSFDPSAGSLRWRFFAPWAPAAGMIAVLSFVFAVFDRSRLWKSIGMAAAIAVCVMSQSRLAAISLPAVTLMVVFLSNLTRPAPFVIAAVIIILAVLSYDQIWAAYDYATDMFVKSRADSSYVRATLQSIAQHRWTMEAPVWGHGIVERGPHLVQFMPIGSHHTWNGLLYVKGAIGFGALAVALSSTFFWVLLQAQADRLARAALAVLLIIVLYSFGENLEILVYLIWPGLLIVGAALKHDLRNPFRAPPFKEPRPYARALSATHHTPADFAVEPGMINA
jgi:hypothetical protein